MKVVNRTPITLVLLCLFYFIRCGSDSRESCDLNELASEVKSVFGEFTRTKNREVLQEVMIEINECNSNDPEVLTLKARLYWYLQDCDDGLKFLNQLRDDQLSFSYQRKVFIYGFLKCLDSTRIEELDKKIILELERYLPENTSDQVAWLTLMSTKSKYLNETEFKDEIDSLNQFVDRNTMRVLKAHFTRMGVLSNENPE